ncbi:MAG: hypothetical protein WKF35_00515 [Ferruginibacter sp.]
MDKNKSENAEEENKHSEKKEENVRDLKKESTDDQATHKGYNEKNPAQPQGSFTPDSKPGK